MKKFIFISGFFYCIGICTAQQVVSSGGYSANADFSVNWILGGSLSSVDQSSFLKIQEDQLTALEIRLKIYPVPVTDFLNIEISPIDTGRFSLELYNSSGVKVINKKIPCKPVMQVDVSNLPSGVYILKVCQPSVNTNMPVIGKIMKF